MWTIWRVGVTPRPDEGEIGRYARQVEAVGGARIRRLRATLRAEAACALLFAAVAALDRDAGAGLFAARIDRAAAVLERLDGDLWDEDQLGPSQEWDRCLWARGGCIDFLARGLEGRARNDEAEIAFHRLLAALNQRLPEVFHGRPLAAREAVPGLPPGGPQEVIVEAGGRERVWSDLLGELARFYERIGESGKAAACHDALIAKLSRSGLQENRSRWAEALFARAGVALEQQDASGAKAALAKFLKHFENRRVDVEQRPDFYANPEAAKDYFESRLAQGYVSLAVCDNVVLGDTASAREHCKRAYDLDDSPFNRVLYACYLARDGRKDEAIRLAGSVEAIPELCYNLACTYALAGRKDQALAMLERDLAENHATPKKRNLQRAWARKDRDLEALRGDPVYEALVADEPESGGR
jgi:tetratricopeptide (TPR) repeat protein